MLEVVFFIPVFGVWALYMCEGRGWGCDLMHLVRSLRLLLIGKQVVNAAHSFLALGLEHGNQTRNDWRLSLRMIASRAEGQ